MDRASPTHPRPASPFTQDESCDRRTRRGPSAHANHGKRQLLPFLQSFLPSRHMEQQEKLRQQTSQGLPVSVPLQHIYSHILQLKLLQPRVIASGTAQMLSREGRRLNLGSMQVRRRSCVVSVNKRLTRTFSKAPRSPSRCSPGVSIVVPLGAQQHLSLRGLFAQGAGAAKLYMYLAVITRWRSHPLPRLLSLSLCLSLSLSLPPSLDTHSRGFSPTETITDFRPSA